jgi:oligosaccharide repeat unit polymerase
LILAQLANHLDGIRYALSVMLMAALFTRYPKTKFVIAAWLLVEAAGTVVRLGSRTEFVLLVFAAAMMYDTLVRPLPVRFVVALGALGLVGFVGFGIARMSVSGIAGQSHNPFVYASEFESLFANVFHLTRVRSTIPDLPAAFFLTDITALIPQQLAPFTKISPADWYVTTYFPDYAAQGGGFAFGTISEAVLSGGWVSALARGAALGFCFAAIHRLHVRRPDGFWIYVFYVWLATLSYQSFRNTTFYLLVLATFRFLPALVVVNLLAVGLRRALRQPANLVPAAAVKA